MIPYNKGPCDVTLTGGFEDEFYENEGNTTGKHREKSTN